MVGDIVVNLMNLIGIASIPALRLPGDFLGAAFEINQAFAVRIYGDLNAASIFRYVTYVALNSTQYDTILFWDL
jgi:hypothetical protein